MKTFNIENGTLELLENCIVNDNLIIFPEELDETIYSKISACLESIGGKWVDKFNGFLYKKNPSLELNNLINSKKFFVSEDVEWKQQTQFYPTPLTMSERMVNMAEIKPSDVLLEPSAGQGGILNAFPKENKKIIIEFDTKNAKILKKQGYNVLVGDFLKFNNLSYDKVVMNPPFAKQQDIVHILHAYSMLNKGGTLVAVANENILYRSNEQALSFKKFLKEKNATVIVNEVGAFEESGTLINTIIIKIEK